MTSEKIKIEKIPAIIYGEPCERLFIYVHGRYASKEAAGDFAEIITAKNYQVLSFDLPEHGERKNENYPCGVQNGVRDLTLVYNSVKDKYKSISLFACSLGAYFSLVAYRDIAFRQTLFLSPILDMERLIKNMMLWSNVTEEQLREEKEIEPPFGEKLIWDYYQFVRENRITKWESPTSILYGEKDNLTEPEVLTSLAERFNCRVEIMKEGEHYFHTAGQLQFLDAWMRKQEYD